MKNNSSKRYSNDFKERIVNLYLEGHQSMASFSREYGVTNGSISKWVKAIESIKLSNGKQINQTEIKENKRLKRGK